MQYPKALGATVPELATLLPSGGTFSKLKFSMLTDEVEKHAYKLSPSFDDVFICGIEAHVCVLQTVLDLIAKGKRCWVVVDGVSSQRAGDRAVALQLMRDAGALLTTSESLVFGWLGSADSTDFKAVQVAYKEYLAGGASALL